MNYPWKFWGRQRCAQKVAHHWIPFNQTTAVLQIQVVVGLGHSSTREPELFTPDPHRFSQISLARWCLACRRNLAEAWIEFTEYERCSASGSVWWCDRATGWSRSEWFVVWCQLSGGLGDLTYHCRRMNVWNFVLKPSMAGSGQALSLEIPLERVTISVPTLVLWGMNDVALLPSLLVGLEQYINQLEIRRLPEGSHWLIHEQPDWVCECLTQFIEPA